MSKLEVTGTGGVKFKLNITQFRSPMVSSINSAQTRTMLQHFPVRCDQPDIQFTTKFRDYAAKHQFQNFVRLHQIAARETPNVNMVYLWWPERGIENWSGYITGFNVAERRREIAPSVTFGVALVDSMMSRRTMITSVASFWDAIVGPQIPNYDPLLQPPVQTSRNEQVAREYQVGNRDNQYSAPPGVNAPALVVR